MTDQYSHYSFSSASTTSRKRPRRLRVKKYVDSLQSGGPGLASSIDMTGSVNDDAHSTLSSMADGSISLQSQSTNGRQSPQLHQHHPHHHPTNNQQQKPNLLGRIRHSLASEELASAAPSPNPPQPAQATLNPPPRYPSKIAYQSSSDDDEILSHDELLGGAFPSSPDAREMDRKQAPPPTSSELLLPTVDVQDGLDDDDDETKEEGQPPNLLSEARAILASASAERDATALNTLPANLSATSSEEAWNQVVQDQSDVTTSREESVGSTPPSASAFRYVPPNDNNASSTQPAATSRYDKYRANAGRNFFRDEKPWSSITEAATKDIAVEAAKPRAEEQHVESVPAAYPGNEVALESDNESSTSFQNADPNQASVFADSDEDGAGIFQDTSNDQSNDNSDDDGGFPATATMLALARKNTPPPSPAAARAMIEIESEMDDDDDGDDHSYNSFDDESSGEEYEVEIPDEEEYDHNIMAYKERIARERKEKIQAAMGLAAAAQSVQLKSTEHKEPSLQRRARSLDDLNYQPMSRRSKKFQMWTEQGVYVRSSDSPSVSSNASATSEPPMAVARPPRESIYEKNASSSWRKSLGALFRWRYPEPRESLDSAEMESLQSKEKDLTSKSAPPRMYKSEEEEKKERAKMLAAAALFKKDDLAHVEEPEEDAPKPHRNDTGGLQFSLAAAAAAMAAKRQENSQPFEDPHSRNNENEEGDEGEDLNPGSLAAQVALLARRKSSTSSLHSAEDYDNLYKKEPPKKEEPKLMVQLRSVKKEPEEEKTPETEEDDVPKLMVQLRPVSDHLEKRLETAASDIESSESNDEELERVAAVSSKSKSFPWPKWGGSKNKDVEAYQAFSERSSYASSLTNIEPVYYKETPSPGSRLSRHILRGVVVLLVLAAIGLPLYFFVFADYGERSTPDDIDGIFPPIATPTPSVSSSTQPTAAPVPTAPVTASPELRPTDAPSQQITTSPTVAPTIEEAPPSPPPSNAPTVLLPTEPPVPSPTISPAIELEDFLISQWPPLDDILNSPGAELTPQGMAVEWLNADPNLDTYSEQQIVQRFSMATFFYSTGGDNWVENDGWLSEENECLWYSSSFRSPCDDGNNLLFLELSENGLSGSLPGEFGLLSNSLTRLALPGVGDSDGDEPQLSGSFPPEYGLLSKLEYIDLNNHKLSGTLAPQIGQLSLLTVLDLEGNDFSGSMPTTMGRLTQLNNLYMAFNRVSGGIPSQLGQLSFLVNLDLYGNQLSSSLPTELGNLLILQSMSLGYNQIEGSIPSEIGGLTSLQGAINLAANRLSGTIPSELGQLTQIRGSLNLSSNRLGGPLPLELGFLENLSNLQLQENELTGEVPTTFSILLRLEELRLEFNNLTGTVPPLVCQNLVWDRLFDATLFLTDCVEEIECPCCQYCCQEEVGCTCQFEGTDNELFCLSQAELEDARVITIP